ncbi:KIR-like protein [Plasmodium coatneyi]|uniref:KIR-like protein n=1 Tax=Plasmodium coatneyi TaxID=208452 RepID=A0A1B1E6E1_9APIC|nr:KIR-like protein [Plasmodium coatneyi]ANQ10586.1 KIR-like protein [Plasmodium coatneyi]
MFDGNRGNCDGDNGNPQDLRSKFETPLRSYPGVSDKTDQAMNAYCFASKMNEQNQSDNIACYFFYYWLGDTLYNGLTIKGQFGSALSSLCGLINEAKWKNGCELLKNNINKDTFYNRKTIHDYSYNYNKIEGDLLKGKPHCGGKWSTHRKKFLPACKAVKQECPVGSSQGGEYCKEFEDKYKVYCDAAEVFELYCESESKLEAKTVEVNAYSSQKEQLLNSHKSDLLAAEEAVNKATTTASISSIFGTLAFTTVLPFLLYKTPSI